jgi:hypothetical protein
MNLEGMPRFREVYGETLSFILAATPEQLLSIAAGTAARNDPLVANLDNQKADDLRNMLIRQMRRHADFRGMVIRAIARMKPESGSQEQEPKQGKQQASQASGQKKEK